MPLLDRPQGALYYNICDIVPPWKTPKETVFFLNGLAVDGSIWATWLPELADQYRIIRADMRGFGRSFVPEPNADWSIDLLARDVLDIMTAEEIGRVHFVGESTGGTVGLHLAIDHSDALLTLTTVSAAHAGGSIALAQQLRDETRTLGMDAWSEKLMSLRFHPGSLTPEMHHWYHELQRNSAPDACADLVDMLVRTNLSTGMKNIRTPTLILAPDDSPFVTVETQVDRLRAIPGAELQVIAGARHGVPFSHGIECAKVLRGFLSRRTPR